MDEATSQWMRVSYPGLTFVTAVSGFLDVAAAYSEATGRFVILRDNLEYRDPGLILRGRFDIRIEGDLGKDATGLPTLFVENVATVPDRHFNQPDCSACMCSPFEYDSYLRPEFDFKKFLERLVIPFLYGQLFFDLHERWPWLDYAHGATGLLEAYHRNNDPRNAAECIERLSKDWFAWPGIKKALVQKGRLKHASSCFCGSQIRIADCHPLAWRGIHQLQSDARKAKISLP